MGMPKVGVYLSARSAGEYVKAAGLPEAVLCAVPFRYLVCRGRQFIVFKLLDLQARLYTEGVKELPDHRRFMTRWQRYRHPAPGEV